MVASSRILFFKTSQIEQSANLILSAISLSSWHNYNQLTEISDVNF